MNGFKTLVLQDLAHVLPSKSLAIPSKLHSCNLHAAAPSRRFWNFFEFSNKGEVSRDSEECQLTKNVAPPEQIAREMEDIEQIPQSIPPATTIASMSINPKKQDCQQLLNSPTNFWSPPGSLKEDNLMSLLDGNSVPKTLKWKLKGYKTLRRHPTDEIAFVPGGKYNFDVDLLSDVNNTPKTELAGISLNPVREVPGRNNEKDIILSTKAIEAKDHARVPRSETVPIKNIGNTKLKAEKQKLASGDSNNADQPMNTVLEPASKIPVAQKPLSLPKVENIKFLPISKPKVPMTSMKCQSQPSARYSSRPTDKSQKPPLHKQWVTKTVDNRKPPDHQEHSQPPDTHSSAIPQTFPAGSKESRRTEGKSNVHEDFMQTEPAKPTNEARTQQDRPVAEMETVDSYQNPLAANNRIITESTESRTPKDVDSNNFAPGPWKHHRNDHGHARFQKQSDQKSLYNVYESMGFPPKEGPPMKIVGPDPKQQGMTSPCAATQVKLQQNDGQASQGQQDSFSYDGGSSMAGNGGGSRKPPTPYPPFTSRRSSSSNSSALIKPHRNTSKMMVRRSANSTTPSSNIFTSSRRPAPKKCDDDEEMIEGKTICTKPREDKCSRQRDDCSPKKSKSKPCKRYCCPALQISSECDWTKSQCPGAKEDCGAPKLDKKYTRRTDPTCLPAESKEGREVCTSPRQSCGRKDRERGCSQICNRHSNQKQRCKRERRSCDRKERSCEKQERRQCDREQGGREICTKPRKRESCNSDCNRRATKCNGRRNFTQSAYTRRPCGRRNINRFFSMTTVGFSLIGMRPNDSKNTLFRIPSSRFYGKEESPCGKQNKCKKPPAKCLNKKSSESKCKIEMKCKPKEDKCKPKEDKCKPKEDKCSTKKNPCQTSCAKSEKKANPCKASTEGDRCAKRRQQICKNAKASSEKESAEDRAERERKEIQECKKNISGRNKNKEKDKKKATGLERVISSCKQKSGKGSNGCGKDSCVAATLNCLPNTTSSLFLNQDNVFALNSVSDRPFSTTNFDNSELYHRENPFDIPHKNYLNFNDDVLDDNGTVTNFLQQPEDTTNDSSTMNNWLPTWLHS